MWFEDASEAFERKIIGGSNFCWDCYSNARYVDFESEFAHGSVLCNPSNEMIYEASVHSKSKNCTPYRWINKDYVSAYHDACARRGIDPNIAWDDVMWVDVADEEEFLEKAKDIFAGKNLDGREVITLNVAEAKLFQWMLAAHNLDITLNQFAERALREYVDKFPNEVEVMRPDIDWTDEQWDTFQKFLLGSLQTGEVIVTFTKKDGSKRVMRCTLDPTQLPKASPKKATKNASSNTLAVYDLDKEAWRSFNVKSVVSIDRKTEV